jgi:histidyl-tRNA synthetase
MPEEEKPIVVSPASEDARDKAFEIAAYLRRITARRIELDLMNRKLGRNLEHASNINASFVVIVGLKELKENKVILKDMQQSTQKEVNLEEIAKILL